MSTEPRIEPCPRRIRAFRGGRTVLDTVAARYVWEVPYYPAWYLPAGDVTLEALEAGTVTEHTEGPLAGLVRVAWDGVDQWFEEDEPVYVHPRSPYVRVDVLPSSRHVQVELGGVVVADSHAPRLLFETNLPVRYYLPMTDVRMDLLEPTGTVSECPYKGTARYWTPVVDSQRFDDVAWGYRTPLPESRLVAGLVCFYNEKVDLTVDGVRLARPHTKFS